MVMTQKEQSRSAARPHVGMWPCCGGYEEPCGPKGRADSLPPTPVVALHVRGNAGGRQVALPLPAKDVTLVMQWLERLRNEAIRNYVATSALEQRFLNQWLLDSRAAGMTVLQNEVAA